MKTFLFNPFRYVAGGKALLLGLAGMLVTTVPAYLGQTHFDGIIDAHCGLVAPFQFYLADQALAWACTVAPFYLAALIFSRSSVRLIDMAGTVALARWPYIFIALVNLLLPPVLPADLHRIGPGLVINVLLELLITVWMVALLYYAFAVSANLKSPRGTLVFIGALLSGEILAKLAFYWFYRSLI